MTVTAVICNYNREALLVQCIDSLLKQSIECDLTVLLVDNQSTDNSVASVQKRFGDRVDVFVLPQNLGASGGFHRGMLEARNGTPSDFVLLLDSDVLLAEGCLAHLISELKASEELGVVGPKVYAMDSTSLVQEFGGAIDWDKGDLKRNFWQHDEAKTGAINEPQSADYVPSCCLLAKSSLLDSVGLFNPDYFLYWDDIDWQHRVQQAGYKIKAIPEATIQHYSGTSHKKSLIPIYYGWRNRVAFFKQYGSPQSLKAALRDACRAVFTCRIYKREQTALMIERAIDDGFSVKLGIPSFEGYDLEPEVKIEHYDQAGSAKLYQVEHVLAFDADEMPSELGDIVLADPFGNYLPLALAVEYKNAFSLELESFETRYSI